MEAKHIHIIMSEMFRRVNKEYSSEITHTDNWYWEREWTLEEQNDYAKWLADYLYNSLEARKEIMAFTYKTKKHCKEVADWFITNYGWKTIL